MLQNGYINAPKTWILPSSTALLVPASHQPVHASESPFYHPGILAEFGWEKSEKNQWGGCLKMSHVWFLWLFTPRNSSMSFEAIQNFISSHFQHRHTMEFGATWGDQDIQKQSMLNCLKIWNLQICGCLALLCWPRPISIYISFQYGTVMLWGPNSASAVCL